MKLFPEGLPAELQHLGGQPMNVVTLKRHVVLMFGSDTRAVGRIFGCC